MAIREILQIPHPVLRQRARKVRALNDDVLRLAYDMVDTMREANGIGLAANQVGELWRVIVIQLPDEEEARIYVNPEIVAKGGERRIEEGCLSIAGYKGMVTRSLWVRFRALDHTSKVVKLREEDNVLAQALEHEVDHLNGILYTDHMEAHEKLVKVEDEGESSEDSEDSGDGEDIHNHHNHDSDLDDANHASHHPESGLWLPEEDSRNTPATLKLK